MNKEFSARTTDDSSTNVDGNSVSPTCPKPIVGSSLSISEKVDKAKSLLTEAHELMLSALAQDVREENYKESYVEKLYETVNTLLLLRRKL